MTTLWCFKQSTCWFRIFYESIWFEFQVCEFQVCVLHTHILPDFFQYISCEPSLFFDALHMCYWCTRIVIIAVCSLCCYKRVINCWVICILQFWSYFWPWGCDCHFLLTLTHVCCIWFRLIPRPGNEASINWVMPTYVSVNSKLEKFCVKRDHFTLLLKCYNF